MSEINTSIVNVDDDGQFAIPGGPPAVFVRIPNDITVHLGQPDEEAANVTVPFIDYIKNVASSELYPTWHENAITANIHAIVSVTMNRIFNEWYRSKGYNFDITNSTQYDQAYVHGRGIYEPMNVITDKIFNQYIIRNNQLTPPLFAQFCDGRVSQCSGMYQWGSLELAQEGFTPLEILKYYYGRDISIATDVPVGGTGNIYPGEPIKLGDSSIDILTIQLAMNRVAKNYPAIPRIRPVNGFFGESTETAIKEFQRIFGLPVTGVIDQGTWYKGRYIFNAVTRHSELTVENSIFREVVEHTQDILLQGDIRPIVDLLQYYLDVISLYGGYIPRVNRTGIFDAQTRNAVLEFQKLFNLPVTGIVDDDTWDRIFRSILGIFNTLKPEEIFLPPLRYPGIVLQKGQREDNPGVFIVQEMLSYIALTIPAIPYAEATGTFDENTINAVIAFQQTFGLEPTGKVDEMTWNEMSAIYKELRFSE
ncbi:MAG: peptidoglycan-binding protein [Sedimentibacter sp.]|uniref:peptidoglycan-binding protein n=1 Tax=Sedimentibacter sp. TaxID=1960295 RepID=UPI00315842F5